MIMDYYVSKKAGAVQDGTEQKPFSTIGQAAQKAATGDTVWIGEGIYREWVCPENGGSDEEHRITYRNIPGERAVISGAELIQNWVSLGDDIWKAVIPGEVLSAYNPYSLELSFWWRAENRIESAEKRNYTFYQYPHITLFLHL